MADDDPARVAAVAALAEPTRRRVYDHVAGTDAPVDRDQVAAAVGLPRTTAAFHLDRLARSGLLDVSFARRSGRTGPGAGRPSKLYRRAATAVEVALPERHYDLAGDLLAGALEDAGASDVLVARARARGAELARGVSGREGVLALLGDQGYEPRRDAGDVVLRNCPFHVLARAHTQLVCGMNLGLLAGVAEAVPDAGLTAELRPADGLCCVRLRSS